ncbi:hypothetical protein [Novosphingobium meiothermophilum]|uniref:hypothetical protein n=1 Tax=Novosphingobium meiothermophilum TaxID=2202251 RepID=UPI001374D1E7|nr:hypothetical protein [Novosphingobium meiothermophilum]
MTRAIDHLLDEAADQLAEDGIVDTFIAMRLAAEGYSLQALDNDLADRPAGH